jgi:membrane AbrB-like protein
MRASVLTRQALRRLGETLLVGTVGGVAFEAAGFPAGLVSGSVVAVAIAALAGRPVMVPLGLTRVVLVIVGIALGSVVTPETLKGLANYPLSIAILMVATACMIAGTTAYLRLVHGWNAISAVLGASPGAMAQVMAISLESGGADMRAIVVVQTIRVLILAVALPAGLAVLGLSASTLARAGAGLGGPPAEVAILVTVSTFLAVALYKIGFPGGWLFGAMIGSAVLHGAGWTEARLPWWLSAAAMICLGALTGSRLSAASPRVLASYVAAALGSFAISTAIAAVFMLLLVALIPVRAADVVIAFAPGAQDTMMLLALALHLDPVFVGAHHLARYLVVSLSLPLLVGIARRKMQKKELPGPGAVPPS